MLNKREVLRQIERWIPFVAALFAIVGPLLKTSQFVPSNLPLPAIIPTFEAIVIFFFLILAIITDPKLDKTDSNLKTASFAVIQFRHAWVFLWACWAVFWSLLAAKQWLLSSGEFQGDAQQLYLRGIFTVASDSANLLNSLGLIVCFVVMYEITVAKDAEDHNSIYSMTWTLGCTLVAIFVIAEACFLLLTANSAVHESTDTPQVFKWLTSLCGGTALALFVGRLESKLLTTPLWILICLYIYAVMQPGYNYFDEKGEYMDVFAVAFLVAKFVMFFWVNALLKKGDLLYYMEKLRPIVEHGRAERDSFKNKLK